MPQRIPAPGYGDLTAETGASLAIDILNSLTAHVAVVNASGVIVTVNDAWKRFASANKCADRASYVGSNYLAVCEDAVRRGADEVARMALAGVRAVLRGDQDAFLLEYACHSPDEERWFVMRVTRLTHGRPSGIVVAHENITAQKKVEGELRDAQQDLLRTRETLEVANRELRAALAREQSVARTDSLTGLYNRRHFLELAPHECAMAERYGLPLSAMLLDIDHFKQINDTAGHQAGDEILKRVAQIALERLLKTDILARYGGEEFIVLLPGSTAEEAAVAADRIREGVAADGVDTPGGRVTTTISIGVAEFLRDDDTLEGLIRRADVALYDAKDSGRNCTVIHSRKRSS